MAFQIKAASKTHPGRIRQINEDALLTYVRPKEMGKDGLALLVVADGIGGHKAGDVASKIAIETIFEALRWFLEKNQDEDTRPTPGQPAPPPLEKTIKENHLERRVRRAIQSANKRIFEYAQNNQEKAGNLGTTITCALLWKEVVVIANVGDSRSYRLRHGKLEQLTQDHSFVGQLIRDGQLPEEAYYTHPRRNVITRALGQSPTIKVDVYTDSLKDQDLLLLCSDGLWEMIRDDELAKQLLDFPTPDVAVQRLVAMANAHGGTDNITAIISQVAAI